MNADKNKKSNHDIPSCRLPSCRRRGDYEVVGVVGVSMPPSRRTTVAMQRDWPGGVSRSDGVVPKKVPSCPRRGASGGRGVVGVNVPALVRAGGADYAANPVGRVVQGQELTPFAQELTPFAQELTPFAQTHPDS